MRTTNLHGGSEHCENGAKRAPMSSRVLRLISMRWMSFGAQVDAKLGLSLRQNGPKLEKKNVGPKNRILIGILNGSDLENRAPAAARARFFYFWAFSTGASFWEDF